MKVQDVVNALEGIAPPYLAAEWDNVGLLVGDAVAPVRKLLLCIDLTAAVLQEARRAGAQMVMAYHPVIFKGVSRVTPADAPIVYQALRSRLAVYSMHTALDAAPGGTNDVLAEAMGLGNVTPLEPFVRLGHCKIVAFVPPRDLSRVADAAFAAGAGRLGNYYDCAYFSHGVGAFCGDKGTHPFIGAAGRHEVTEEMRLEIIAPAAKAAAVCAAIREAHSYEEPAIDVFPMQVFPAGCGMGRVGRFAKPLPARTLIERIKGAVGVKNVQIAPAGGLPAAKAGAGRVAVAACGAGSCGSLFRQALAAGATFYLTGELRHHDALAASAAGMTVVCLGHSHSERLTLARVAQRLKIALPALHADLSRADRDPFEIG